jgi:ABC-type polysaccharide/polyol phosphate transport system ATPase subunit
MVRLAHVGKRFRVPRAQRTALRVLRSLVRGDSLREEFWALRDVSFELPAGGHVALIGRNGSGKTTLLRLLAGILAPTIGTLHVASRPRALFSTSIGFSNELSAADNVFLFGAVHGMVRRSLTPRLDAIIARAGIDELRHAPLKDLSMGQVQRLALSIFAETPERFLVFDEVLGNVDRGYARTADAYFRRLAAEGRTVVMTSHDPAFLRPYCERAIWIENGRVHRDGPFEPVMLEYESSFEPAPDAGSEPAAGRAPASALAAPSAPAPAEPAPLARAGSAGTSR